MPSWIMTYERKEQDFNFSYEHTNYYLRIVNKARKGFLRLGIGFYANFGVDV